MQPTRDQVHHDSILENFSRLYRNQQDAFISERAMPVANVQNQSDYYFIYDAAYWFTDEAKKRAPGGDFVRSGYTLDTGSYHCHQWGIEHAMPDEVVAEQDAPLMPEQTAQLWLDQKGLIRKERLFAAAYMTGVSTWTSSDASATDWDNSSGVPIDAVNRGKRTVLGLTGMEPNALVMGLEVFHGLVTNDQITGLVKYVNRALPTDIEAVLAPALGLTGGIYVSKAAYNSSAEGTTASYSQIIDDDALLYYRAPFAGRQTATAGTLFAWTGGGGLSSFERYRDERRRSDIARFFMHVNYKLVGADLGYWFGDIT